MMHVVYESLMSLNDLIKLFFNAEQRVTYEFENNTSTVCLKMPIIIIIISRRTNYKSYRVETRLENHQHCWDKYNDLWELKWKAFSQLITSIYKYSCE